MTTEDVAHPTGDRLALLRRLGFGELTHDSHVPFLSHLLGTRRLLIEWDERPALCDAGLFHSAYGTEYFQPTTSADRVEVRGLIGDEAEAIAWTWCTIRRDTIDPTSGTVIDRNTDAVMTMSEQLLADIATLWTSDTVEQIARMSANERSFAHGLRRVLPFAGPRAQAAADGVLSLLEQP